MWLGRKVEKGSPPPNAMLRPRLFSLLDLWPSHRVILIRAAAGYGKSSLVATWVAAREAGGNWARALWLAADPEDSDPIRFVRYVAAAFDRVLPGSTEVVLPILADRQPEPAHAMARLLSHIEAGFPSDKESAVLFLIDDYHQIRSSEVDSLLSFFIDNAPDHVHIIILSRNMPELSLARLYVSGQLLELNAEDLKLTLPELQQLLESMQVTGLTPSQLQQMLAHTEGWVAGLKLAGMSLAGSTHPETVLGQLRGTSHWQAEYLSGEVLYKQPSELRQFLLQTSILNRLQAGLCAAVTEDDTAPQLLAEAYSRGLFLMDLDNTRTWFRYHPIFQELLQLRLREQLDDAALSQLHFRAGEWFVAANDVDSAVHHFTEAGAVDQVVKTLEEPLRMALNRGDVHQAQLWLKSLAPDLIEKQPSLLLFMCRLSLLREEQDLVSNVAKAARAIQTAEVDVNRRSVLEAELRVYEAAVCLRQSRPDAVTESIARAAASTELLDEFSRGTLEFLRLHHESLRQPWEEVAQHAQRAIAAFERADFATGLIAVQREVAMMSRAQGNIPASLRGLQSIILSYPSPKPHLYRELQSVHLRTADLHYWMDNMEQALIHINAADRMAEMMDDQDLRTSITLMTRLIEYAGMSQEDIAGDVPITLAGRMRVSTYIDLDVRYLLRTGQYETALAHSGFRSIHILSDPFSTNPALLTVYAASYVANGRNLTAADELINGAISRFRELSTRFHLARMLAIEAWRLQQLQELDRAAVVLTEAVDVGEQIGISRHILDIPQLAGLLPRVRTHAADGLLSRMIRLDQPHNVGGIDALTARERDILSLLAQDYRYQDVANALFISIDTVRKHATSIYRKLGVNRRLAAVEIAKQAGLVQSDPA